MTDGDGHTRNQESAWAAGLIVGNGIENTQKVQLPYPSFVVHFHPLQDKRRYTYIHVHKASSRTSSNEIKIPKGCQFSRRTKYVTSLEERKNKYFT